MHKNKESVALNVAMFVPLLEIPTCHKGGREEAEDRRQKKERDPHHLPTQGSDFVCNLYDRDSFKDRTSQPQQKVPEASSNLSDPDVPLSTHSCPYRRIVQECYCITIYILLIWGAAESYRTAASETSSDLTIQIVPLSNFRLLSLLHDHVP